jgi:hypothetical protein
MKQSDFERVEVVDERVAIAGTPERPAHPTLVPKCAATTPIWSRTRNVSASGDFSVVYTKLNRRRCTRVLRISR